MGATVNLERQAFGDWTVLSAAGRDSQRNRLWLCRCCCGKEKVIGGQHLRYGQSKSCGCKSSEYRRDKISGEKHYLWKGGSRNAGSIAWCAGRLSSLRGDSRRRGGVEIVGTPEEIQSLFVESGGACQACGDVPSRLHLDHCHATGRIRGFICNTCNVALGMVSDDAGRLRKLAEYIGKVRSS